MKVCGFIPVSENPCLIQKSEKKYFLQSERLNGKVQLLRFYTSLDVYVFFIIILLTFWGIKIYKEKNKQKD